MSWRIVVRYIIVAAALVSLAMSVCVCVLWWRSRSILEYAFWSHCYFTTDGGAAGKYFEVRSGNRQVRITLGGGHVGPPRRVAYLDPSVWNYHARAKLWGGRPIFDRVSDSEPIAGSWGWDDDTPNMAGRGPLHWSITRRETESPQRTLHIIIVMSHWFVAALLAILPAWLIATRLRRCFRKHGRVRKGLCATCGYDMRATPDRCPECGAIRKTAAIIAVMLLIAAPPASAEFLPHVKLVAGKIVDGSTTRPLTYSVRAPETFKQADAKKWPAIVILHGSNVSGKAYVSTIASAWPDIARDYILLGINGEQRSDVGDEPRFNYTYVDYVGRSTFKGFPGTDRESPALVAEAMDELRGIYPIAKYFVGGHSQGGFLTYSLLMNFPEKIAGAFPISAGVIFQCEPSAYDNEKLRAAQRAVPLAIVHGKQDQVVDFDSGEYAATIFGEANWPAFHFFVDDSGAGHRFALLPVDQAIRWLEAQSSDDPKRLLDFAEQRTAEKSYRDAIAAVNRARSLKLDAGSTRRLENISRHLDAAARAGAEKLLPRMRLEPGKEWIDDALNYRDDFEFAPAVREVMQLLQALRAKHEPDAKKLLNEATAAFRQNNSDIGFEKCQQIADNSYAATCYRNVKRWLAARK